MDTKAPTTHRHRHIWRILFFAALVFVVASALTLGGVAYYYQNRFYPGVSVGGLSLTNQNEVTGQQAVTQLANHYLAHQIKITVPDITKPRDAVTNRYPDLIFSTTAKDLGLEMGDSQASASAWAIGHQTKLTTWISQSIPELFTGSHQSLPYRINRDKLTAYIHTTITPQIITPTPAKVVVQGDQVTVTQPTPGLQINEQTLANMLADSLNSAGDGDITYIKAPTTVVDSTVTVPVVTPVAERLRALGNVQVSFVANNFYATPKKADILTWFSVVQDDSGQLSIALQKDALAHNLQGNTQLDQTKSLDAAVNALKPILASSVPSPKLAISVVLLPPKPVATVTPGNYTLGKFEGKYVEVNLAEQKMYLINGSTLEKTFIVSSGKWSTPTPTGVFSIHDKTPRAYSAEFGLYMPWWQDFLDGAYGLHELPEWPNGYKEGQSHLGTPVSHGCVRLGVGDAKTVYDWTEIGTPVYIH